MLCAASLKGAGMPKYTSLFLNFERDFYCETGAVQFRQIDQNYFDLLISNPPKVETTERYVRTYNKFRTWIERGSQGTKPYRIVGGWKGQKVE